MTTYYLDMCLRNDTTGEHGDEVAGLIDQELEQDVYGFPYLCGQTLKDLLSEKCDNIVTFLPTDKIDWNAALTRLFGVARNTTRGAATWQIGDACLPEDIRMAVADLPQTPNCKFTVRDLLESLTAAPRQLAVNSVGGLTTYGSLPTMRVAARDLIFTSCLETSDVYPEDVALLAAACLALRHMGLGRNRGGGEVRCSLRDETYQDITHKSFTTFAQLVKGSA